MKRSHLYWVFYISTLLSLGCSDNYQTTSGSEDAGKRNGWDQKDDDKDKKDNDKDEKNDDKDEKNDDKDEKDKPKSQDKASTKDSNKGSKAPEEPTEVVESFFLETVEPAILNSCRDCHAPPRDKVDTQAPLTVYSSEKMYKLLVDSETFEDSTLLRKVMGKTNPVHAGGTLCQTTDTSPCAEFGQWWEEIFGTPPSASWGDVTRTDKTGLIQGLLKNPNDEGEDVVLEAYDGPAEDGKLMATDTKEVGRFSLRLDADKIPHAQETTVHIYAKSGDELIELGGSPFDLTAYVPQDEAFFDNTVSAAVQQGCGGCHGNSTSEINSYSTIRSLLIAADNEGNWSRSENYLMQKSSADGVSHQGGSICPGAGVCAQFQEMWDREFSPE